MKKVYIFHPEKEEPEVIELAKPPTMEFLQEKLNGGYFQMVPWFTRFKEPGEAEFKRCTAYCDENGKFMNLPLNEKATKHWHEAVGDKAKGRQIDVLLGPVIVLVGEGSKKKEKSIWS